MNKRFLTIIVLGLCATLGWFISATYVEKETLNVKDEIEITEVSEVPTVANEKEVPISVEEESLPPPSASTPEPTVKSNCYIGGCSGQICSDSNDVVSTCEWREEYACYRSATCERQSDGQCGWTETEEFNQCLNDSATEFIVPEVN